MGQYNKEHFPINMCIVPFITFHLTYLLLFNYHLSRADVHIADWDHDHHHTHAEKWEGTCRVGKKQSPINIVSNETLKEKWGQPFVFHGYEKRIPMHTKNNRHSVLVEMDENSHEDIWIRGGGLGESKFKFAQLHFHWGSTNDQGSEHTIDGVAAPMEMHIVHWNLDVGDNIKEATEKDSYNSFEVLGVLYKIGKENKNYDNLFNAARKVSKENTKSTIKKGTRIKDLLPEDTNAFYRYRGSLSTPPCNEIVMWTIFKEPVEISQSQIDIMRKAYYHRDNETEVRDISNNYRSVQKVHKREVLEVDTHVIHSECSLRSKYKTASNPKGFGTAFRSGSITMNKNKFELLSFFILTSFLYRQIKFWL